MKYSFLVYYIFRVCSENIAGGGNIDDQDEVHIKANDVFHLPKVRSYNLFLSNIINFPLPHTNY